VVVFVTMAALSLLRWPANTHLFVLGILSFSAGVIGRMARRRGQPDWLRVHVTAMAVSYILLLTAFYVDNGPHLPLWRSLPPLAHWSLPASLGSRFRAGCCDAIRSFCVRALFTSLSFAQRAAACRSWLVAMDAMALGIRAGSFDVAVLALVLFDVPERHISHPG
jgi:hypothetical protein